MSWQKLFPIRYDTDTLLGIDWSALVTEGYQCLLLDIDNTLALTGSHEADAYARQACAEMQEAGLELLVVSNSSQGRGEEYAATLGLPVLSGAGKPWSRKLRALKAEHPSLAHSLMVGDQLFTDVWAAKYMGIEAILVRPRKADLDFWYVHLKRWLEKPLIHWMTISHGPWAGRVAEPLPLAAPAVKGQGKN